MGYRENGDLDGLDYATGDPAQLRRADYRSAGYQDSDLLPQYRPRPDAAQPSAAGTLRSMGPVVRAAIAIIAPLNIGLAALGGFASFTAVRDVSRPFFGDQAWIVPVGIDLGILGLLAWDLLMEHLDVAWPVLRWVAWAFIAGTVFLNISAGHGDLTAGVEHAAMPILFITTCEGIRHLIRRFAGLAAKRRPRGDKIPLSRWIYAPWSSMLLHRRMVLWNILSYEHGLRLEVQLLQTVSELQQRHGRWLWRWRASQGEKLILRLQPPKIAAMLADGTLPDDAVFTAVPPSQKQDTDDTPADPAPQANGAKTRRKTRPTPPSAALFEIPDHGDAALIAAGRQVAAALQAKGLKVTQTALGKELRARGFGIPNNRLKWLADEIKPPPDPR